MDLSLKHNAKLLDENAALSELVSRLRAEIRTLSDQVVTLTALEANNTTKVQNERAALMDELLVKQANHENELKRLLDEISRLHQEKNDLEIVQKRELQKIQT